MILELEDQRYIIRAIEMPRCSKGFIMYDEDGVPNIYIDQALDDADQLKRLIHEINHDRRGDMDSDRDIREIEADETPRISPRNVLSHMKRASDLIPPNPKSKLTPRQLKALQQALSALDRGISLWEY